MLQGRNVELSQSLTDFHDIPARVSQLQEALEAERRALNHQRQQNRTLKDSVQSNLERLGLRSQQNQDGRKKRKAVDLYLELVQMTDDYRKVKGKLEETLVFLES